MLLLDGLRLRPRIGWPPTGSTSCCAHPGAGGPPLGMSWQTRPHDESRGYFRTK
jgi:hypothetical protein